MSWRVCICNYFIYYEYIRLCIEWYFYSVWIIERIYIFLYITCLFVYSIVFFIGFIIGII